MNKYKKQTLTAISLLLIATFIVSIISIQPTQATINKSIKNWAYVEPQPRAVGVGQPVTVIYGIDHLHPIAQTYGPFFEGFTVTITDPDGNVETKSNLFVDSTSFGYFTYTPEKLGNYSLQLTFAGQWVNLTAGTFSAFTGLLTEDTNIWFEPATSAVTNLAVQEEAVSPVSNPPLPTDYWTTPVYSENKGWTSIMDNWLMPAYDVMPRSFNGQGAFSPYSAGPNSGHILWTTQLQAGGLTSARFPDKSIYPSEVYEQYYHPLIFNGRLYYADHGPSFSGDIFGTRVLDLYTGEEVMYMTNVTIDMIQTLDVEVPNKHGIVPYLWTAPGLNNYNAMAGPVQTGLTWQLYDAWTGNYILKIVNATGGFPVIGPNGEILVYSMPGTGDWMSLWNSTKCLAVPGSAGFSPTRGSVVDWKQGLEWNVTLNAPHAYGSAIIATVSLEDDKVLVLYDSRLLYPFSQPTYPAVLTDCAYAAKMELGATSASPVWVQNRTNIYDVVETHYNINEGMYSVYDDAELKVHTYDVNTGAELSVSPVLGDSLYTVFAHTWMAYGNTYVWCYDGHMRCVDGQTGNVEWDRYLGDLAPGQAYGQPPVYQGPTIADGKVYLGGSDHTPDSNMWVGSKMWCFDAYTGQALWNVSGWYGYSALSNGYLTTYNGYNVEIYTFGKGPSKTTVSAPLTQVTLGESVTITGTVTDQSPGQKDTPCVSEDSMSAWMEYLHMQKQIPANATGVPVSIDVIDANGNHRNIGATTSDMSGFFSYMWEPDIAGKYTVIATFAGSNSYGSSYAEAAFGVADAPTPAPTQQTQTGLATTSDLLTYMAVGVIAIIIAVAIATVLLLRKRP